MEEKADGLTQLINDKAVCRTAPASPGLLVTTIQIKFTRQTKSNLNSMLILEECNDGLNIFLLLGPFLYTILYCDLPATKVSVVNVCACSIVTGSAEEDDDLEPGLELNSKTYGLSLYEE